MKPARPIGMRTMPANRTIESAPTLSSLYLFCGPAMAGGRLLSASELADDCMRRGSPAMVFPAGADASRVAWPSVPMVALFSHDDLDDDALHALADALIQAGVHRVVVSGCERRRRGPFTFEAVP